MKTAIIFDPAHGKDVPGKRSPDGRFLEYLFSREILIKVMKNLLKIDCLKFDLYAPFLYEENEPGLTNRVKEYNKIAEKYNKTLVISLHSDAIGNVWQTKATGVSVWTSRGEDLSDPIATDFYNYIKNKFLNEKFRTAFWLNKGEQKRDPDWEANFTVLAGNSIIKPLYNSFLIEWLFQDNKEDVKKLTNVFYKEKLVTTLTEWLLYKFN